MKITELQEQFLREKTFDRYDDHSVLEVLLQTACVSGDITLMVNNLYDTFGTTKCIFKAQPEQLMIVPAVNQQAAMIISMIAPLASVWKRSNVEDANNISNSEEATTICKTLLMGEQTKQFYVIATDSQANINGIKKLSGGIVNDGYVSTREIAEMALSTNAKNIILTHNNPNGTCEPSLEDIKVTWDIKKTLKELKIRLQDHIIVAGDKIYSMKYNFDLLPPEYRKVLKPEIDKLKEARRTLPAE